MKKDEVTVGELLKLFLIVLLSIMITYAVIVGTAWVGYWLFSIGFWFGTTYTVFIIAVITALYIVWDEIK